MKERLTAASIELFERKGFSDTAVQDICQAVGVTKGTFYYYFDSKESLLMDIHLSYIDEILHHQVSILSDTTSSHQEKLFNVVFMLLHDIERKGASGRVFFREMRHLNAERMSVIVERRNEFRMNIERLLCDGVARGIFRDTLNPRVAAFAVLGMANWSYQWFHPAGELSDRDVATQYVEMILDGIRA